MKHLCILLFVQLSFLWIGSESFAGGKNLLPPESKSDLHDTLKQDELVYDSQGRQRKIVQKLSPNVGGFPTDVLVEFSSGDEIMSLEKLPATSLASPVHLKNPERLDSNGQTLKIIARYFDGGYLVPIQRLRTW